MQMICNKFTISRNRKFLSFLGLALTLLGSSCERTNTETGEEAVTWPEITHFDDLAFRADGLVRVNDLPAARVAVPELLKAGLAVTPQTIPSNAADPQEVSLILGDLTSLVDGLATENLDDESMKNLILGLHPVIAKLIEATGMPHIHANEGPNSGFLFPVFENEGKQVGTVEIKLHDDAGDLEVWLTQGGFGGDPWRLSIDSALTLAFPALEKKVTLGVRDRERNEDESGASTIQDGTTHYFVFPGPREVDASWLMGPDFAAKVELSFEEATTGSFVLRPHIHRKDDQ